ncbi:hypothetical protein, partial [Bradyrhizobium sp.]|uniref:hypothetical protein n=1 Tax=Bradyrhizobium sp. TaxID=376 RepID=UPI003BAE3B9B
MGKLGRQITCMIVCSMLLSAVFSSASNAQENIDASYFCAAEVSGGLWYNNSSKKWEGATFKV